MTSIASSIPSKFKHLNDPTALSCESLPVVDFAALSADDPDQRSKAIDDLSKACQEWGFFTLVNHGVPEDLMNATFSAMEEFFNLEESMKMQYAPKSAADYAIKYIGFDKYDNPNQTFAFWGEKFTLHVHPKFHCPDTPRSLREAVLGYSENTRRISRKLVEAVSDALQLERGYADRVLGLDSSSQAIVGHKYPACPHPDQAIGIIPHTDPGLFTLLIHNGVPGLQIEHNGQWFNDDSPKNTLVVNVTDQLETFTNGRYKSINHRVVVNEERERFSIASFYAPSNEAVVGPAAPLVEKDGRAMFRSVPYEELVEWQLAKALSHVESPALR